MSLNKVISKLPKRRESRASFLQIPLASIIMTVATVVFRRGWKGAERSALFSGDR